LSLSQCSDENGFPNYLLRISLRMENQEINDCHRDPWDLFWTPFF
jgi:hypothetical protein